MSRARGPRREQLVIILPHLCCPCLSVNVRISCQKAPYFYCVKRDQENGYLKVRDQLLPRTPTKMRKGASQGILLTTEKQKPPLAEMGGFAFCFPRMALIASAAKRTQTPQVNQSQGQACPEHSRRATARQRAQSSPAPAPYYQHTPSGAPRSLILSCQPCFSASMRIQSQGTEASSHHNRSPWGYAFLH
jgi:hypothetical protein